MSIVDLLLRPYFSPRRILEAKVNTKCGFARVGLAYPNPHLARLHSLQPPRHIDAWELVTAMSECVTLPTPASFLHLPRLFLAVQYAVLSDAFVVRGRRRSQSIAPQEIAFANTIRYFSRYSYKMIPSLAKAVHGRQHR